MRITALSSAAAKLGELKFKVSNADDLEKMARLEELSVKVSLELDEQNEAAALIEELSAKYGALGLEVSKGRDSTKKTGGCCDRFHSDHV